MCYWYVRLWVGIPHRSAERRTLPIANVQKYFHLLRTSFHNFRSLLRFFVSFSFDICDK